MTVTTAQNQLWAAMSDSQREQFEQDGFIILRNVLTSDEVSFYAGVLDRVYAEKEASGGLAADGSLHLLSAVTSAPELRGLIDHPGAFPLVWSMLGWNAHIYHSHLDVHPGIKIQKPFRWEWHQDGGRQNREIESDPRPRLSVKLAYWLSDVTETGRGNLMVIPGSHKTNWLPGPPNRTTEWPAPEGAIEVQVGAGDVVFFDRRIWHARSNNYSDVTRKVVFLGYTYRWIAIRDEVAHLPQEPWWADANPVQQQLLGGTGIGDGDHHWGHYPEDTPLYVALKEQNLLTRDHPPLIP
jgi:ectoine hydroxylase-related dioxygenase (phytanoyl-CoA dioxygenase family)